MAGKKKRKTFKVHEVMPRFNIVAGGLIVAIVVILLKAGYLMFFEHDYWKVVSQKQSKSMTEIPATRGNILACDGRVLATSLPEYSLFMDFVTSEKDEKRAAEDQYRRDTLLFETVKRRVTLEDSLHLINTYGEKEGRKRFRDLRNKPPLRQPLTPNARLDTICRGMHAIFPSINPDSLKRAMLRGRLKKSHHWRLYPKRVSYIQYCRAKSLPVFCKPSALGGFHVDTYHQRKNPYGKLAARTVGDLYGVKDSARSGLELSFDSLLRGKPGRAHMQKILNRKVNIPDSLAIDGCDIYTTLDIAMQDLCEKTLGDKLKELGAESGVCILMEVKTGDVKAITSLSRCSDGNYREISNLAITNLLEPGSVFKPMSLMVAIDDGYINNNTPVYTGTGTYDMHGRKMRDSNWEKGGNGQITAKEAIQRSSNIGISRLIDQYYYEQPEKFVDGIYRIGVAEDLHLPLKGYARPSIRRPNADRSNWSKTALAWMSIGYETQIPPISTLTFYNGVANGGRMVRPRFVTAIKQGSETVQEFPVVTIREHMCKESTLRQVQAALFSVVQAPLHATGKPARSKHFHISGKTGTAQLWTAAGFSSEYLVSFAGYFPSEAPQYSMIVCIRKRGVAYGGLYCGPVFRTIAETVMAQNLLQDYSHAADTLHSKQPHILAGNLQALSRVLGGLNMRHSMPSTSADGMTWGKAQHSGSVVMKRDNTAAGVMPDVTGYGMRDAVYRLERMGLRVKVSGKGSVRKQSIPPGRKVKRKELVYITFGNGKDEKTTQPESQSAATTSEEAPAPAAEAITSTTTSHKTNQ